MSDGTKLLSSNKIKDAYGRAVQRMVDGLDPSEQKQVAGMLVGPEMEDKLREMNADRFRQQVQPYIDQASEAGVAL